MPTAREPPVYRVAQIDREVKFLLEDAYADIWIEGEVSNSRPSPAGHVYFRLNDWQEKATLEAVIFASDARRSRVGLKDGLRVRCRGKLTVFEPQGRFQLVASRVELAGLGELLARIEELKKRLAAEGLFDEARKKPLPRLPRTIGVVTSREGAAIRDVIEVAHRRFPVRILLAHAAVQGDMAPMEIVWGLKVLDRRADVDVLLVTRGGGSIEDLMAFNDERVVRAIAACTKPVVSAVGHEIDFVLSDLVADVRAPTPSAAAERIVPEREVLRAEIGGLARRLAGSAREGVRELRRDLDALARAVEEPSSAIQAHRQVLDGLVARAERVARRRLAQARGRTGAADVRLAALHPQARLSADRRRLDDASGRVRAATRAAITACQARAQRCGAALGALSPVSVLGRGYSITLHAGRALREAAAVAAGDPLEIVVEKGRLRARVE